MSFSNFAKSSFILATLTFAIAPNSPACSVCGCSLCSDWAAQGYETLAATDLNVRFEYLDQTQLRSGTDPVDRSALEFPNDREVQLQTLTRAAWLGLDHVFAPEWGISAEIPYYDRYHTTIAPGDIDVSTSRARGLGDLKILGRYQQHHPDHGWSLQAGLKVPTGKTDQTFAEGPQEGELLDRGLQLGTGSWEAVVGATYFVRLAGAWDSFAQVLVEQPLTRHDDFRPGTALNLNLGIRWLNTSRVTPMLQVNAHWDGREHGANADFDNSGDGIIDLSPGLTVEVTRTVNAFAFVQVPLYQRVNGFQIEPRWQLSTGFRWRL